MLNEGKLAALRCILPRSPRAMASGETASTARSCYYHLADGCRCHSPRGVGPSRVRARQRPTPFAVMGQVTSGTISFMEGTRVGLSDGVGCWLRAREADQTVEAATVRNSIAAIVFAAGVQPYTWLDDRAPAVRPTWASCLARSPGPVAGARPTKTPKPRASRLESDIHGIQTGRGQFTRIGRPTRTQSPERRRGRLARDTSPWRRPPRPPFLAWGRSIPEAPCSA